MVGENLSLSGVTNKSDALLFTAASAIFLARWTHAVVIDVPHSSTAKERQACSKGSWPPQAEAVESAGGGASCVCAYWGSSSFAWVPQAAISHAYEFSGLRSKIHAQSA